MTRTWRDPERRNQNPYTTQTSVPGTDSSHGRLPQVKVLDSSYPSCNGNVALRIGFQLLLARRTRGRIVRSLRAVFMATMSVHHVRAAAVAHDDVEQDCKKHERQCSCHDPSPHFLLRESDAVAHLLTTRRAS